MPNYVKNIVTFRCSDKDFKQICHDFVTANDVDFNKIIPMPEPLNIENSSQVVEAFNVYEDFKNTLQNEFDPDSEEYKKATEVFIAANNLQPEFFNLGKQAYSNFVNYGAATWYEWCIKNWGTKWNASSSNFDSDTKTISFETAWSAPVQIFNKWSEMLKTNMNKDIEMDLKYADEDMGNNCGEAVFLNGNLIAYLPRETLEFACEVWGCDPKDFMETNE